ncbi:hypothetical protein BDZ91DRAFT_760750 [Kalaharituber pfeilii]|nr:hypothetical protein BDZ91DRAFT_760750 [Kalaharituber pfeilii]
MTATAISLVPSTQGASQFLIALPPGFEPRGILCSRTVTGSPETSSNNQLGRAGDQQSHAENAYAYNDPFPEYDAVIASGGIFDSVFNDVFPVVPAPSSHYPEMVNHPIPQYLLDENQNGIEEIVSSMIDQSIPNTFFDSQNPQPTLNAAAAASQQSEIILWMSPIVPHNFVPAPSLPEYDIRFEESAIFAPPLLADDSLRADCNHLSRLLSVLMDLALQLLRDIPE